ncbi:MULTISPECIES: TetR family transcriptional regulator [Snodgrassella]|uniref:TetR family transcriptional regulator n=1 Tax=Snodgrassella TaxID=1193515 RepID=UPI00226AF8DA|nr:MULTISPECIES: TetR family transcriptional regulator [unclassified Snodgrassella]MCT6881892.1 TetR family transcriptional regulator [Snodgrassella alvi]MCX8747567.1 TetR family transcriptional regulator [Snodgrassella sp. B3800]MCX8749584.1 TetR family transcriptional regulator [Snodgrassella sp. B3088]
MRKTKEEALQTRDDLMAAALDIFYRRGVSRASLQEIASAAGVTRGALYWHFKNKEDLFDALFQQVFSKLSEQLRHDIDTSSPDALHNLMRALNQMFQRMANDERYRKFCYILHLNCEHTEDNRAIVALLQKYQNLWWQNLCAVFQVCCQQHILPENINIRQAALYFQALFIGLTNLWLTDPHNIDITSIAPNFINIALESLHHNPNLRQ